MLRARLRLTLLHLAAVVCGGIARDDKGDAINLREFIAEMGKVCQ